MKKHRLYPHLVLIIVPYLIAYGPFRIGEDNSSRLIIISFMVTHLGTYLLAFQAEGIKRALAKKEVFEHFIGKTFLMVIYISFYFTAYYHSIYISDPNTFSGVKPSGFFYDFVQLYFFSSGITLLSGFSPIEPASLYSQTMIYLHSLVMFIAIVILVANYRDTATLSFIKSPEDYDSEEEKNDGKKGDIENHT